MLGHRGARHASPENTLLAFERARQEGADGVELDVRLDRDGRVIVLHDRTLERVSRGTETRDVETLGSAELARIDVGSGERVPALADVLAWATEHRMRVNVELKSDVTRRRALLFGVRRAIRASGVASELVLFSSFHPVFVRALSVLLPDFPHAWLVEPGHRLLRRAPFHRAFGADGINPHFRLVTAPNLARWKRYALPVSTWTVNDDVEARRVAALGVDAIISDRPGGILAALKG
ncbi:MAG TPA: glycerophosphodiester phosphodiesterase [Polyangiaceae bacterium]